MNELYEICTKLNGYGNTPEYEILNAVKNEEMGTWELAVRKVEKEAKDESDK